MWFIGNIRTLNFFCNLLVGIIELVTQKLFEQGDEMNNFSIVVSNGEAAEDQASQVLYILRLLKVDHGTVALKILYSFDTCLKS